MRQRKFWLMAMAPLLAVVLGACGQSSDLPSAGGTKPPDANASSPSSADAKALAFAKCMRDNGLPDYPDPAPGGTAGNLGGANIDRTSTQFKNAYEACKKLLPSGGELEQPDTTQMAKMVSYAKCMRENGLPDFADPGPDGFDPTKWDVGSPAFKSAAAACKEFLTWR